MTPRNIAVFAPLLLYATGVGAAEQPKTPESAERMIFGSVHEGNIFTAEVKQAIDQGEFTNRGIRVTRIEGLGNLPWVEFPPRWKIEKSKLALIHAEYAQFGGPGLQGPHERGLYLTICDLIKLKSNLRKAPSDSSYGFLSCTSEFGWGGGMGRDALITELYEGIRTYVNYKYNKEGEKEPFSDYEFFYDLAPAKPDGWVHFVLASEELQLSLDDHYRISAAKKTPEGTKEKARDWWQAYEPLKHPMLGVWYPDEHQEWALGDQIKDPPFNERFHAFVKGETYFFLTDSGKVYMSKKPEKGDRKLELLWDNDRCPITAALEDADTGKVFLFGKAAKDDGQGKDFYWELDETVNRRDYDPSQIKSIDTLEPLKTVMEYARFLADEKEIKLPDPADKGNDK